MSFKFGKKSLEYLKDIEPKMKQLCELALKESKVDFSIIDGLRTAEQQNKLYKNGKSELDGYVTKSYHQTGMAVDVVPYVKGINCFDYSNKEALLNWYEVHRAFLRAGRILRLNVELGLTYNIGGSYDYPHIQINE